LFGEKAGEAVEGAKVQNESMDIRIDDRIRRTGIDEPMIAGLVRAFYGKVRQDELLGPIFERKVEDWEEHFRTLASFWSSIALATNGYGGRPLPAHLDLGIEGPHFARWLELFRETAQEICPPEAAAFFIGRAETIARSFQMGLEFHRSAKIPR
jgi:hemoglobin